MTDTNEYDTLYVKAWSQQSIPITLQKGERIEWEFKIATHDISFEAKFVPRLSTDDDDEDEDIEVKEDENGNLSTTSSSSSSSNKSKKGSKLFEPPPIIISPATRITDTQSIQTGTYLCPSNIPSGVLYLHFDNTYSKLRGKTLHYSYRVFREDEIGKTIILLGERYHTPYGIATVEGKRPSEDIYIVRLEYGIGYFHRSTFQSVVTPAKSINQRCYVGVQLFFNNRIQEAEQFFGGEIERYPIFSLAYSSMGFLRALMTWERVDIDMANSRLKQTRHLVNHLLPPDASIFSSITRFVTGAQAPVLSNKDLELSLIKAECYLLEACLLLSEESMLSYVKAGLKIRSAWKLYEKCWNQVNTDPKIMLELDESVKGGIQFGIGAFNVIISVLPSILLRIVSALGFPSNRALGLKLLSECAASNGVRSPLSALTLLFFHIIIPSFFTIREQYHVQHAQQVFNQSFAQFPSSSLFLWMEGRFFRMKRSLDQAVTSFHKSARGQPDWKQLQHLKNCWFVAYDINSDRSKAFFLYMQFIATYTSESQQYHHAHPLTPHHHPHQANEVHDMPTMPLSDDMIQLLQKIEPCVNRKFGGRTISVEQFILQRTQQFLKAHTNANKEENKHSRPILTHLELIYLFYGFMQQSPDVLQKCHDEVSAFFRDHPASTLSPDHLHLAQLIHAAILKAQQQFHKALEILLHIENHTNDSEIVNDKYILPFIRFEIGTCYLEDAVFIDAQRRKQSATTTTNTHANSSSTSTNDSASTSNDDASGWKAQRKAKLEQAALYLKKAEDTKYDYHFKNRLHLRIHLAVQDLKALKLHDNWSEMDTCESVTESKSNITNAEMKAEE